VLAGHTVYLDLNKNGLLDTDSLNAEPSLPTDQHGNYRFENLPYGSYHVAVISDGMKQTSPITTQLTVSEETTGSKPRAAATGDLDRDGLLDLAVAEWGSDHVSVFIADGAGGFHSSVRYPAGSNPASIISDQFTDDNTDGNVDGNDYLDLVVANFSDSTISLLRGQ
ncbi:MAG: hypothetical protein GY888_26625, partial [Planctomycetaceae bacterium]|nr:hypothetical protein [Planctomycetaceae bacterium]